MPSTCTPFADTIARITHCNPFTPERVELERVALGTDFVERDADWNVHGESESEHPNVTAIIERASGLADEWAAEIANGAKLSADQQRCYDDFVLFVLYYRYRDDFDQLAQAPRSSCAAFYRRYLRDAGRLLNPDRKRPDRETEAAHLFACFYQIKRAFSLIFKNIIGASQPVARFRAAVWQSIFTHDIDRYRRVLYGRMGDFTTLITGPSGTGKELAAQAIGLSRYVPFDERSTAFADVPAESFHAVNLSALSPALIESELFGHKRGAFTGALSDRTGWLDECPALGTVFLDEIGDVDVGVQVKLLRVLENRTFQRLGETKERRFEGKLITATHRDLARDCGSGRFREDFYYRLCSDMINAPSLAERIRDSSAELPHLVGFIARRLVGDEGERLAREALEYIDRELGADYAWPGNVRELEQCMRNVLIRKQYRPRDTIASSDAASTLADSVRSAELTADELLHRYCALVYARTGSYSAAARRLGLDRRTVKDRIASSGE